MSRALFERLVVAATQRGVAIREESQARYIRRLSDSDAVLMAQADTSFLSLSRSQKLVRIRWQDETYLVTFGIGEPDPLPLGVEFTELTPGLFASSVLAANVLPGPAVTGAQIQNAIEGEHAGIEGYAGHELSAVAALFPPCATYRVSAPEPYVGSDHRFLGAILARSYADGPLHIDPATLQKFAYLFESGPDFLPYQNLLQGLLSFSWGNLFLETYRCLEQLYAQPRVSALTSVWSSPLALREVVALLENHLSWRPKEEEALSGLIRASGSASLQRICSLFNVTFSLDAQEKACEALANRIYKLRNNIVHYRPIHETVSKPDDEWNSIVQAMLDVTNDVYTQLGGTFFQPAASFAAGNAS